MNLSRNRSQAIYEIQVQGELDQDWQPWFDGMGITLTFTSDRTPITIITSPIVDQAALRGLLCKLWDLNLKLISVRLIETDSREETNHD